MAEEEKQEQEGQEPEGAGPEAEASTEEPAAGDAQAAEADSGEPEADAAATDAPEAAAPEKAPSADEGEPLTPKQRRKLERSRASGPARPPRPPADRAAERDERRRSKAGARRRRRGAERAKRGERREGTPLAERRPGSRKVRQGTVVSSKADKTITVEIEIARRHPVYEKVVRRSATVHAHDEGNDANEGDVVRVIESRPLSRTKRWRLVEVLERAR